jgi:hypothetical protein
MRTVRKTPQAINEPLRILGVSIYEIGFAVVVAFVFSHWGLRAAALSLVIVLLAAKWVESIDPRWFNTVRIALRFNKHKLYDPLKRSHFHTRVIE